ncbi:C6 transcription factor [Pyrenophora seminiperda CCB06]|uniref:C6 transcription factor n=1 Tax=Pyrenophora seminiperda CCB06 TaxID=1302712 RepID=A0A3M7M6F2_9PLEO|nr:C6 transcription factor [Pyrenophora seminiperda CCB06]
MDEDDMDASLDGGISKRAKAQRQRVHISEEYEKKIDRIEDRLAGIENVLASLSTKLGNLDLQKDWHDSASQSRSSRVGTVRSPGSGLADAPTPTPFEGESSINSQSDYAREMLAQAIGSTPSIGENKEVKMALTALSEMVSQQSQNTSSGNAPINRSLADVDPTQLERPPWPVVCKVLDKAIKYPTMAFALAFPYLRMANLKEISEDAYHNAATCSAARRVLTYGVLENLFNEFRLFPLANMDMSEYGSYAAICKRQSDVALSQLDIFMPANYENILALVFGAAQAIELGKASLCWIMTSCAASLCQNLGFHRINTMVNDTPAERHSKIQIFWMIYMFDKTLSLRLGRSSVLQDWDISLPFLVPSEPGDKNPEGNHLLSYWIKVARVQGSTYEKLFCPAAFLRSTEERTQTAIELVQAMNQAWYERGDASVLKLSKLDDDMNFVSQRPEAIGRSPNETPCPSQYKRYVHRTTNKDADPDEYISGSFERAQDIFFHSDVVMHYSICALIQRAVSPGNMAFTQACLESSRDALVAHMRANAQFNKKGQERLWSGYVHWSVLQAPFTPFIVIFCNAIQTADTSNLDADLNSLSEFVGSLESCRTISEGADKLYRMCHLFLRVARLYIIAKTQDATSRSQNFAQNNQSAFYTTADNTQLNLNAMSQFDPYLSALGLMNPDPGWPMDSYNGTTPTMGFSDSTQTPSSMGVGFGMPRGDHNPMQDWFSGSRYLMNLMEPGDDLQMPGMDM